MDAMSRGDWDAAFEGFCDDCRWHSPGIRRETIGRDAARRELADFVDQTGARYQLVAVHEHGGLTVVLYNGEATSGAQPESFTGVAVIRWRDGRVAELWGFRG